MTKRWIGIALAVLASGSIAQGVYKYKDSSGNTVYTDKPPAGNGTVERVEIPAASVQPSPLPTGQSEREKQLLEAANRRVAELNRAAEDVVTSFNALRAAEARRDEGAELQDGDRDGRWLSRQYWTRRQALERDVEIARARLEEALVRRNALR